jgi:hypothetical protein
MTTATETGKQLFKANLVLDHQQTSRMVRTFAVVVGGPPLDEC